MFLIKDYITIYQKDVLPYGCEEYDMSILKTEYEKTQQFIHKTNNKFKNENKLCTDRDTKNKLESQIAFLNARDREIAEEIMMIEEYLPYGKRLRLHKWDENYRKSIYDPRSENGFMPESYKEIIDDPLVILENKQFKEDLLDTLSLILTKKQYEVIYYYFVYNLTQNEIAQYLHTSQQNISAIIETSLEKIQKSELFSYFFKKYSKNGCIF